MFRNYERMSRAHVTVTHQLKNKEKPYLSDLKKTILREEVHLMEGLLFGKFKGAGGWKIVKYVAWKQIIEAVYVYAYLHQFKWLGFFVRFLFCFSCCCCCCFLLFIGLSFLFLLFSFFFLERGVFLKCHMVLTENIE